jgi:hypothetical protein
MFSTIASARSSFWATSASSSARCSGVSHSFEEMIAVVENYIYEKKKVRVRIELRYHPFFIHSDMSKLNYCYGVAIDYFKI